MPRIKSNKSFLIATVIVLVFSSCIKTKYKQDAKEKTSLFFADFTHFEESAITGNLFFEINKKRITHQLNEFRNSCGAEEIKQEMEMFVGEVYGIDQFKSLEANRGLVVKTSEVQNEKCSFYFVFDYVISKDSVYLYNIEVTYRTQD